MKKYIASLALGTAIGIAVVFGSGVVSAAGPTPVGAHRHYIVVNEERVYVGPNFCELDATAQGFAAFHAQVHLGAPGLDVQATGC